MRWSRLVLRELSFHRANTLLGMVAVAAAAGSLSAALSALSLHDMRTRELLRQKRQQTEARVARLQDDYRVIMKKLGFNILILPKGQNMGDFYAQGFAEATMPEGYVYRLASNRLVTVRHLLPSLQQKIEWPERHRKILLTGVRDEVPIAEKTKLPSIAGVVEPGTVVLGSELARETGLKPSDELVLLGKTFRVAKVHPERGTIDDITLWMDLDEAQALLGKEGKINAILALECACAWSDIGKVRQEIGEILPGTKVIESDSAKALARAEGRYRAAQEARAALAAEKSQREEMRGELEAFASMLVPAVVLVAVLWLSLLAFSNVRQRRYEIALLRALGMPPRGVLALILSKMGLIGFLGALFGGVLGVLPVALKAGGFAFFAELFPPEDLLWLVVGAVLLSILAGWGPALFAATRDPADILREE